MRITVSHTRSKAEMMKYVDRSFDEISKGDPGLPVRLVMKEKSWDGSVLTFAFSAKMGIMSTPIKGTVEVTDHDITIDADLGMLNRLVPEQTARDLFTNRIKGFLN
jgi:hypothetical protein